jgi:hypothetical protein
VTVIDKPAYFLRGLDIAQSLDPFDRPPHVDGHKPSQVGDNGLF